MNIDDSVSSFSCIEKHLSALQVVSRKNFREGTIKELATAEKLMLVLGLQADRLLKENKQLASDKQEAESRLADISDKYS